MRGLRNIYNLGMKELRSLLGDKAMLTLIVFAFTVSVYSSATVMPVRCIWRPSLLPTWISRSFHRVLSMVFTGPGFCRRS
ncbi:antibiotic transport system permease component [Klebsiella michiganensis]|uniref:Antibiotic transport system permease component n=1 Tax=Klebsiella michiganensis TaxID=1134687 RepID=A0A7H4M0X5_9ENTR|nr:antibiotic transport system permease component [Klebsiella michiganensis]